MAFAVGLAMAGGSAAGHSAGSGSSHWVVRDLGTLGGGESYAVAVNQRGEVIGQSSSSDRPWILHPFVWRAGRLRDLRTISRVAALGEVNASTVTAANAHGQIVGYNRLDQMESPVEAFLWQDGKTTILPPRATSGRCGAASALNDHAQIVGWIGDSIGFHRGHATLWKDRRPTDLGSLPGLPESWAVAINEQAQIVGTSYTNEEADPRLFRSEAFIWRNGELTGLGTLPRRSESWAIAINGRGQVVGRSYRLAADGSTATGNRVFVWQNGRMRDLGTLGGTETVVGLHTRSRGSGFEPEPHPQSIDSTGRVVGSSRLPSGSWRAFLWRSGRMISLGLLPGDVASEATGINDHGLVVGNSYRRLPGSSVSLADGGPHAFAWQSGVMTSLPTLGGPSASAVALNAHDRIAGWSTTRSGLIHAVLWTRA